MMNKQPERKYITVDSNEDMATIQPILKYLRLLNYEITIAPVKPSGDYRFGNVIIERKTIEDFDGSFKRKTTSNMWDQCQRMREWMEESEDNYGFIFIIGDSRYVNHHAKVDPKSRLGAVGSILARYGIPVTFINDESGFVLLLDKLYRSQAEGKFGQARELNFSPSAYGSFGEYVLSGISGVSGKRAEDILEHFDVEVKLVPKGDIHSLTQIDGIGPKTLQNIRKEISE